MLKRYELPSVRGEGWGIIILDTDRGIFAAVSDYGNYCHMWTHPGCEFRQFIINCDDDYFQKKLMHERPNRTVFDGDATKANIVEAIETYNNECLADGRTWSEYAYEKDLLEDFDIDTKSNFDAWQRDTSFSDTWEYAVYIPEPQCASFCKEVMGRFREMLKKELAQEAHDLEVLKFLRGAESPLIALSDTAIKEAKRLLAEPATGPMVGPDRKD